jgi:hypothetical protein
MSRTTRRWLGRTIAVVVVALVGVWLLANHLALHRTAYLSGWVLLGLCVFLAAYNGRKKLTYPPLGSSATWLQLHIYGGLVAVAVFLFHTAGRWPNGGFEVALALLFWGTAVSGVLGIFITRWVPRRLTLAGDEVIYERIPAFREQLRARADALVLDTVESGGGTTLAEFHAHRLAPYFAATRSRFAHLAQSSAPLQSILTQLDDLKRYFNEQEKTSADELAELIRRKDKLDYHAALQGLLKGWLFVHIPLTFAMLIAAGLHVLLVYAFGGASGGGNV